MWWWWWTPCRRRVRRERHGDGHRQGVQRHGGHVPTDHHRYEGPLAIAYRVSLASLRYRVFHSDSHHNGTGRLSTRWVFGFYRVLPGLAEKKRVKQQGHRGPRRKHEKVRRRLSRNRPILPSGPICSPVFRLLPSFSINFDRVCR